MSAPGTNKEKIMKQKLVEVQSFLLFKIPVTNELYNYVMEIDYDITTKNCPVVNVSWIDAVNFCNNLSEKLALEKCYIFDPVSEKIIVDDAKNGFKLPTDAQWQYACRGKATGYRYGNIEEIAWFEQNSEKRIYEVKTKKRMISDFSI